ncbi:uncharacterized protein TNIN_280711 [Trichonephila inaurata madagascariensis]|uniref:Uncharacterized protein n=1 Tax=Trichonephila inaurata madagascariensis TaxID=2747483 RepID=A0A8X7CJV4_9ARAC|nr:uncharacterized protein TNIN_280711 [Trichonephila inaurata madagascariensis]
MKPVPEQLPSRSLLKVHWKRLLSGTLLSSGGLGCLFFLHSKERSKWTLLPLIAGSIGVSLMNLTFAEMCETDETDSENLPSQTQHELLILPEDSSPLESLEYLKMLYEEMADVYIDENKKSVTAISKIQCEDCKKMARNVYNETLGAESLTTEPGSLTLDLIHMKRHDKEESIISKKEFNEEIYKAESEFRDDIYTLFVETRKFIDHIMDPKLPRGDPEVLCMTEEEQDRYKFPCGRQISPECSEVVSKMRDIIHKLRSKFEETVDKYITSFRESRTKDFEEEKYARLKGVVQVIEREDVQSLEESGTQTEEVGVSTEEATLQTAQPEDPSDSKVDESKTLESEQKKLDEADVFSNGFSNRTGGEYFQNIRKEVGDMVREMKRRNAIANSSEKGILDDF